MVVKSELEKLGIQFTSIELTEVETKENVSEETLKLLDNNLRQCGLELIENRKVVLAERIKTSVIDLIHNSDELLKINLSDYLSKKLNYDYTYLANIFSEIMGASIEKFYIAHKVERVKELLEYNELNLKEISYITQYSSIGHLSNQFKKITGLAPTQYRNLQDKNRSSLSQIAC